MVFSRVSLHTCFWLGAIAAGLTACTGQQAQTHTSAQAGISPGKITIDGSSTVYPITQAIAKEFRQTPEGAQTEIDVKFSGTTAGFRKFCAGETDISDASRPILTEEKQACIQAGVAFIELPIAFDALTIVVNPQNTWAQDMTVAELKTLWAKSAQGKITKWNQIRPSYPNEPIQLFGAGSDSGTFDYFNEVLTGELDGSRTDYVSSEDDTVLVRGVSQSRTALGYIPHAYYEQNTKTLKALSVDDGRGAIAPTAENVQTAKYQPFSRPLMIYVNAKAAQDKPELQAFVEFYLRNAKTLAATVGYVPLPEEGYRLAEIQFTRGEVGTAFNGVPEPNVTIAEVLRRQANFQTAQQANKPQ